VRGRQPVRAKRLCNPVQGRQPVQAQQLRTKPFRTARRDSFSFNERCSGSPRGASLHPMADVHNIAPRVIVYPHGSPPPATGEGCIALAQLPRGAGSVAVFGDGSHPTTRLCAAAVDLLCRQRHPRAVLDVGTGTGILARIARARGAGLVVGTDIDPVALSCAHANARLEAHPAQIEISDNSPDHWGPRFDLVVANILQEPLEALASALGRALAPGGLLLISGFTRPQTPSLRVLYEKAGMTVRGQSNLDEWVLLTLCVLDVQRSATNQSPPH
jgi:ribosomal protein L11 methylase PrmA